MKSSEAKIVAQCVADMIDVGIRHNIKHVPLKLSQLVVEYLTTYIPEPETKNEIVEIGSSVKEKT